MVHAIDIDSLRYKYGEWFVQNYTINESERVGIGSTASVYRGNARMPQGVQRAAFKVVNKRTTAANASLFLDRSMLSELEVHRLLQQKLSPACCKHLLLLLDCQMFPPLHAVFDRIRGLPGDDADPAGDVFAMYELVSQTNSSSSSSEKAPPGRAVTMQVILVFPLCELGALHQLRGSKSMLPTRCVPLAALTTLIESLPDSQLLELVTLVIKSAVGLTAAQAREQHRAPLLAQHLISGWGQDHCAMIHVAQLPAPWMRLLLLQVLTQVCKGLDALHRVGVVHCDVKLENVFLTHDPDERPFRVAAKLGDLGMCRCIDPDVSPRAPLIHVPGMRSAYTSLVKGTPGYCAPEMIEHGRLAPETDVYSLAVLCTLALDPSAEFVWFENWIMKLHFERPADMSEGLASMLQAGMSFVPAERPSLAALASALQTEFESAAEDLPLAPSDLAPNRHPST